MKLLERRLEKLERAIFDSQPVEPWAVHVSRHLFGSTEADAEEQAFRQAHPGMSLVICSMVDASRKTEAA